jgi:DNA topoisomerase-1
LFFSAPVLSTGVDSEIAPSIISIADISREETHGMRELGTDPKSGKPVSVRFGRYGAFAQIGHKDDEEKPR